MIALLAVCPIRIKNYAALEIGRTFKEEQGNWWITLPYGSTKTDTADQRPVPDYLNRCGGALPDRIKACLDRLAAGDKFPLDLFADWTTLYDQEPWDADLKNHP